MYQFVNLQVYARVGAHRKNSKKRKASIEGVVAELLRSPHACSHVPQPRPPTRLFGRDPASIPGIARERASGARDKIGRRLRCDSPVVMCGVTSWPIKCAILTVNPAEQAKYFRWRRDVLEWLKTMWGPALMYVVEHTDEPFPHLHFCAMPTLTHDACMTVADVHPGYGAAKKAADNGCSRKDQKKAYKEAMVAMQDSYYEAVGAKNGLVRLGPGRQRLTREEWKERKRQAAALAAARVKFERDLREAAAREFAARMATIAAEAELKVATAIAAADGRVSEVTNKAKNHIVRLIGRGQELDKSLKARHETIAQQEDEIAQLRALLAEHGILPNHQI